VLFKDVFLPLGTFWLRSQDEAMPVMVLTFLVSIQWGIIGLLAP
jgi:hypothetical protein